MAWCHDANRARGTSAVLIVRWQKTSTVRNPINPRRRTVMLQDGADHNGADAPEHPMRPFVFDCHWKRGEGGPSAVIESVVLQPRTWRAFGKQVCCKAGDQEENLGPDGLLRSYGLQPGIIDILGDANAAGHGSSFDDGVISETPAEGTVSALHADAAGENTCRAQPAINAWLN